MIRIGLIGARGHTGAELLKLLASHPQFELALASSRARVGEPVDQHPHLNYVDSEPAILASTPLDAIILALPNGLAAPWVQAAEAHCPNACLIDLSADYRFDDGWTYGLPQANAHALKHARRIANPGCYATAMQLGLLPVLGHIAGRVAAFGVSGYSGAGTTPSPRNDPQRLADNLLPYALGGHIHQHEVARHAGCDIHFMPHVASYFRGLSVTLSIPLDEAGQQIDWLAQFTDFYAQHPLVSIQAEPAEPRATVGSHQALIGGFHIEGGHLALVSALDNLLKGAASQAIENLNLAFELPAHTGLTP